MLLLLIKLKTDNYITSSSGLNVVSSPNLVGVFQIDGLSIVVRSIAEFSLDDEVSDISSICRLRIVWHPWIWSQNQKPKQSRFTHRSGHQRNEKPVIIVRVRYLRQEMGPTDIRTTLQLPAQADQLYYLYKHQMQPFPLVYSRSASADQWTVNWEKNTRYGSKHSQAISIQHQYQWGSWKSIATKIPVSAFQSQSVDNRVDENFSNAVSVFCEHSGAYILIWALTWKLT